MPIIIIRHAHDNEIRSRYLHDKEITHEGKREAKKLAEELIDRYGKPDIIYSGPMRRTEQTLKCMFKHVEISPKIVIDNRLSRYFNSSEQNFPSIFSKTQRRNIPIRETKRMFKNRCDSFSRSIRPNNHDKTIWIITHAIVLKRIANKLRVRVPSYINFLEYYRL